MLKHLFKIAFRNMWKYKTQSLTGMFGLAFGLACFVPALYWLRYETSYDSFYPDAKQIYRIYAFEKQSGKAQVGVSRIIEKKLHEYFPATETSTLFLNLHEKCRTVGTPHVSLLMVYTDSTFFNVFPQLFVSGDTKRPLQIINNIVLKESVAIRLFGDAEKAIGQQVQTTMSSSFPPYTVTAVVKDPPPNTNLLFDAIVFHDMLTHYSEMPEERQWEIFHLELYVRLNPDTDIDKIAEEVRDLTSRLNTNKNIELRLMPISDIRHYFITDAPFTLNLIWLFVASGILLLFSAVFNFMNLHFDLFRQRIRDLRHRSVHGATSGQLVLQMLFELTCSSILALLFSCYLVVFSHPIFSGLLNIEIGLSQLVQLFAVCGIGTMILILLIGFIFFRRLSRIATLPVHKRKIAKQPVLRRMAVTLQLIVSIVFIVATLVVMMQVRYVDRKDLGFDSNGFIHLSGFLDPYGEIQTALMHELTTIPQIESITDAYFEPKHNANPFIMNSEVDWLGKSSDEKSAFHLILTDSRFAETFRLKKLLGEWWNEGETKKIVLNEEAVRVMGLNEPVGSVIRIPSAYDNSVMNEYIVAGVVKDFHTLSLRSRILPTIFMPSSDLFNIMYLRVVPGQEQETIRQITAILPDIDPSLIDVTLTPISELYDNFNHSEQAGLKMFSVLATVCLLISLFGIYAVAAASTLRRRKEIAIRKVSGATVSDILRIFFREYTLMVIIAGAIALPPAYLAMSRWLQGYAYRTNIPGWLLAGVIAGVIAVVLLTVLGQVLKAANSNPGEVVKSE